MWLQCMRSTSTTRLGQGTTVNFSGRFTWYIMQTSGTLLLRQNLNESVFSEILRPACVAPTTTLVTSISFLPQSDAHVDFNCLLCDWLMIVIIVLMQWCT